MTKYVYGMKKCPFCNEERKSTGLHKHIKTHGPELWKEYLDSKEKLKAREVEGGFKCSDCDYFSENKKSVSSHWWRNHTEEGKKHKVSYTRDFNENPIWNKGLTKETDERLVKSGKTYSDRVKNGDIIPHFTGKTHTTKAKQTISEKLSVNNKGGRCKWYEVDGIYVQGTWERDIALKLKELGITWIKSKKKEYTLKYEINGKIRNYTPDFYLPDYDVWLEIKGFWWGNDKEKMRIVKEQHPEKNIKIVEKEEFKRILRGELVW